VKKYNIAVIEGDGIGPEVIQAGKIVLEAVSQKNDFNINWIDYDLGAERYLKTGEILPDSVLEELKKVDAIYLGAIGDPRVKAGVLEKGLLLKLRFSLDQYINLRPIVLYEGLETPIKNKGAEDIDFVVVRENTEGLYLGIGGFLKKGTEDEVATQMMLNTRKGVERAIRYAFELTRKRKRKMRLTLVDKANVLTFAHDLWGRAFYEIGKEYEDIEKDHAYVDACCMWFIKNPEWFDVIVTCNMFGDIITDLGAVIQGGMGVAAGGNINPEGVSMFEPIHGSAPKYAGKGMANPIATILAGKMLLETIGEEKAGINVEEAVKKALKSGKIKSMSAGKMGMTTSEVGELVSSYI